jgi:RNA polymerase sigma factor (sigma-70 family)
MGGRDTGVLLRQIRTLFTSGTLCGLSDSQLLESFVARRDGSWESAFAILLQRHGPMVLGVCRRILVDPQDVEDAFQATFLVLTRKAGSIRVDGSVGRWLFGVATRVARRARADVRRRRAREKTGVERLELAAREAAGTRAELADLQAVLAEELVKLPARFQAPVVLCDLEGSSHEQAARWLGWPVGTVKSRLSRARARLRRRLRQRGLAPNDLALAVPSFRVAVPARLIEATTDAARVYSAGRWATAAFGSTSVALLTKGVLRTMLLTKPKLAAVALVVMLSGSAALVSQTTAQKPGRPGTVKASFIPIREADEAAKADAALDLVILERAWADAIPRRDLSVVNRILADDFIGIDLDGHLYSKTTIIPDLRSGDSTSESIELDEIHTCILGDTAVVTCRVKNRSAPAWGRRTDVYVKRQGRWQCLASHMCPITETIHAEGQTRRKAPAVVPVAGTSLVGPPSQRGDAITKLRPRFECLVERVRVHAGQAVKKGDPLVDVFGVELIKAKNEFRAREVQWIGQRRILQLREQNFKSKSISHQLLVDTQNDEEKSRLELQTAREKLKILGLDDEAIERVGQEDGAQKARLTLRSPVDGTVVEVGAELGNLYDTKSVVIVIDGRSPEGTPRP